MNKKQILKDLNELVTIQSVSADPKRYDQIEKAAHWIKSKLHSLGFDVELIDKSDQPPLVVGKLSVTGAVKTLGVYAHYDVQPEDPVHEWSTPPFTVTEQAGKFFARGVADDKGHLIQTLAAIEELKNSKKLNSNIVCIFEGEEEIGSVNFAEMVDRARGMIQDCDVFYIMDGGMKSKGVPAIEYGLRGLVYFELTVRTGESDLHSGLYGNAVYNPALIITDLISRMKNIRTGELLIPGITEKLRKSTAAEIALLKKFPTTDAQMLEDSKAFALITDEVPTYLKPLILPSLDIHGFISGYTGEGAKTVIPKEAKVKFSLRLVEHMDPDVVEGQVKKFIKDEIPKGIRYELQVLSKDRPFFTGVENEFMQKTAKALETVFGHETAFLRSGGSIPAAEILSNKFNKPAIITGFVLSDCNMHAPNENTDVDMFWKGIEALNFILSQA